MTTIIDDTIGRLRKIFAVLFIIAAALFVGDVIAHKTIISIEPPLFSLKTWGYFLFVISLITGVGVPILLRANFQKNAARTKLATIEGYNKLQQLLLVSVFISCISADAAYFFPVHIFYLYGAFFSCLYGIYSVIPYRKKIAAEMKFYNLI